jgi:hypothetical protein
LEPGITTDPEHWVEKGVISKIELILFPSMNF